MNKSELFTKAHVATRLLLQPGDSYSATFAMCLVNQYRINQINEENRAKKAAAKAARAESEKAAPAPIKPAATGIKRRKLIAVSQNPATILPAGAVVEGFGKKFRIGADHPSMNGSHLLGHEGELGCYCYYYI